MKILHISDIHFGTIVDSKTKTSKPAHIFANEATGENYPEALAGVILGDERLAAAPPKIVICSGDIGWSGDATDYRYAKVFFETLRDKWRATTFCIVPGNHDVTLELSKEKKDRTVEDSERQDCFFNFLIEFYGEAQMRELFPLVATAEIAQRKLADRNKLIYFNSKIDECLLLGLNSAASINGLGDPVTVGKEVKALLQLPKIRTLCNDDSRVKICTLHHHLFPFVESPFWASYHNPHAPMPPFDRSIISNSADLQVWLKERSFDLVCHGHKHDFHGREDLLWRVGDRQSPRRLAVIGAGSAGVEPGHLPGAKANSYTVIDVLPVGRDRTYFRVTVARQDRTQEEVAVVHEARRLVAAGAVERTLPNRFEADKVYQCHALIKACVEGLAETGKKAVVRNFVSVVRTISDEDFDKVKTASLDGEEAKATDFKRCFEALHPNWGAMTAGPRKGRTGLFSEKGAVICHEDRLFRAVTGLTKTKTPLQIAFEAPETRRYVSLYDAEIALSNEASILPGLVGVQFVEREEVNGSFVDIVLSFRNIDLRFWWVVNQLEGHRLLELATRNIPKRDPKHEFMLGNVVVFAARATWEVHTDAPFLTEIDKLEDDLSFIEIVIKATSTGPRVQIARSNLARLFEEYADSLNRNNLRTRHVEYALSMLRAVRDGGPTDADIAEIAAKLEHAHALTRLLHASTAGRSDFTNARAALKDVFSRWRTPGSLPD